MNVVIQAIKEHIADSNVFFVFPSQVSASRWARKTCTLGIARSVAADRFLAWDRFKEDVVRAKDTQRRPSSALIRKLFAESLIRKNAESVFFKSIVPPEYARRGKVFAPFIAGLLPSLFLWEKLSRSIAPDSEDEDFALVKKEYAAFLERYNLFEPSWEEAKIRAGSKRYAIFFPELIEDFSEYDALLEAPRFFRINAALNAPSAGLVLYQSAREEIRSAVMELHRLHNEEGVPYEEMAVSVPELGEIEPYLLREFALRCIPVVRRAGKKLGETGAGRLFALASECAASQFSFSSLKALLLNDQIPWKERVKNKALVSFGIKYNCVSSYKHNGKTVDIWDEAFKESAYDSKDLRPYYGKLKERIRALIGSENFSDVRKYYFAFRRDFLDMETVSEESDAVLSRCIAELGSLIDLEEMLDDTALTPDSPFSFFLSHLGEVEYVKAAQKSGVNIFKWRVAAAAPFACHFVLNASQRAAAVLYQPMRFLRQDKRRALGLEDTDASAAFFALCDTGEDEGFKTRTRMSASAQSFSGWDIPHSVFARGKMLEPPPCGDDPYRAERRFWVNTQAGLPAIFPPQKAAYEHWKDALAHKENSFSFFMSALGSGNGAGNENSTAQARLLSAAILGKDGSLTVTPTRDLNVYYDCPMFWLYARIFSAREFSLEAALLDDTALGLLYHVILEELFAKIKTEDNVFSSAHLNIYKRWAAEITREAIKKHPAFKGPLAVPLVSPQATGMAKKIAALLDIEAESFDGYTVAELEFPVNVKLGDIHIKGVIDRISISPEGDPIIVDYKTAHVPKQTPIENIEETALADFQMPLYIKLYEEYLAERIANHSAIKVQDAFFYNIKDKKIKSVMTESREGYEPFLEAAKKQTEVFAAKVTALDFAPDKIYVGNCAGCVYKTACRTAYFLNRGQFKSEGDDVRTRTS